MGQTSASMFPMFAPLTSDMLTAQKNCLRGSCEGNHKISQYLKSGLTCLNRVKHYGKITISIYDEA